MPEGSGRCWRVSSIRDDRQSVGQSPPRWPCLLQAKSRAVLLSLGRGHDALPRRDNRRAVAEAPGRNFGLIGRCRCLARDFKNASRRYPVAGCGSQPGDRSLITSTDHGACRARVCATRASFFAAPGAISPSRALRERLPPARRACWRGRGRRRLRGNRGRRTTRA